MGGLYITPNSTEIGWKRRALRVSSEALLCIGVATIVASFVVDTGQTPNIWILIGGVIMIMAASIGWTLTFCLICDEGDIEQPKRDQNAPIHSVEVVVPRREGPDLINDTQHKIYDAYFSQTSNVDEIKAPPDSAYTSEYRYERKHRAHSGDKRRKQQSPVRRRSEPSTITGTTSSYTETSGSTMSSSSQITTTVDSQATSAQQIYPRKGKREYREKKSYV